MAQAGYAFDVIAPQIPEPDDSLEHLPPAGQAEALAYFKARSVSDLYPGRCVLGADTVVAAGGRVLGKAADAADARQMLTDVSAARHAVITGVALLAGESQRIIASDVTYVTMRQMTAREIDDYVASGEWIGKAGAYAIQETADRFVDAIEGSFSNIVGLPMELVGRMLDELARGAAGQGRAGRSRRDRGETI